MPRLLVFTLPYAYAFQAIGTSRADAAPVVLLNKKKLKAKVSQIMTF
jgi:hypothetical protein